MAERKRSVEHLSGQKHNFLNSTENAGFVVYNSPAKEKLITYEQAIQEGHYQEVELLLIGFKEACTKICALSGSCH
jgi:hypothetical protein